MHGRASELAECLATCAIFSVQVKDLVADPCGRLQGQYIHKLYVTNEYGLWREITVYGTDIETWRTAVKKLLSPRPQPLW